MSHVPKTLFLNPETAVPAHARAVVRRPAAKAMTLVSLVALLVLNILVGAGA